MVMNNYYMIIGYYFLVGRVVKLRFSFHQLGPWLKYTAVIEFIPLFNQIFYDKNKNISISIYHNIILYVQFIFVISRYRRHVVLYVCTRCTVIFITDDNNHIINYNIILFDYGNNLYMFQL